MKNRQDVNSLKEFDSDRRDQAHKKMLERLFAEGGYSSMDILRNWPAYVLRRDIPRFLAHYELFKQVIDLPGCIVELGVYKGAGLFTWSNLLETFCATDRFKKVFGFDHFEGLKQASFSERDGKHDQSVQKVFNGYKASREEVETLVELHNRDSVLPGTNRCRLIDGDVTETLPRFLADNPGLKIALLNLDLDLYLPTKFAIEILYPLVVHGGIICFDEYGLIPWQGETNAVDEYFSTFKKKPVIRKFPFYHSPGGYLVK